MARWSIPRVQNSNPESINRSIEDLNLILAELEQLEQQLKGQGGYVAGMNSDLNMNGNHVTGLPARPVDGTAACSLAFHQSGDFLYSTSDTITTKKTIIGIAATSPAGLTTLDQIKQLLVQLAQGLDATAAPPRVADASDIGTLNKHFAREQHTHQGVNLDAVQTITGRKTHQTDLVSPLILGSVASGGTLTLRSTEHATKGKIDFGTSAYDEVNNRLGLGTVTPTSVLHAVGLPAYANNAAALAGGLTIGAFYRTGADPDPVCVVH